MGKRRKLGAMLKALLEQYYTVTPVDIGADSRLSKSGMTFTTESYDVEGAGHLCILNMNAMLGLMKMETVVLSSFEKDMPLFNLDWVSAFGNETQIAELYDVQLEPYPQELLDEFTKIKEADSDIADYPSSPAWYDGYCIPVRITRRERRSLKDCPQPLLDMLKRSADSWLQRLHAMQRQRKPGSESSRRHCSQTAGRQ